MHTIYKVVSRKQGSLWSCSTRAPNFMLFYSEQQWMTIPIGLSFVFIDQEAAKDFLSVAWTRFNHLELWQAESQDEPQQLPGMAKRWDWLELFWEAHAQKDVTLLAELCQPCPETYFGVKTIRLVNRLH